MSCKRVILVMVIVYGWGLSVKGQQPETVIQNFEQVLSRYIEKSQFPDTKLYLFYGNKDFPYLVEKYNVDGRVFSFKYLEPDSLNFFYKNLNYQSYINFITDHVDSTNCPFADLAPGVWVFVVTPSELWEQFYFDDILKSDTQFVTPILDIIKSTGKKISYQREMIVMSYTVDSGFDVTKTLGIRREEIICE